MPNVIAIGIFKYYTEHLQNTLIIVGLVNARVLVHIMLIDITMTCWLTLTHTSGSVVITALSGRHW